MKTLDYTAVFSVILIGVTILLNSLYAIQVFNFTGTIAWFIEWKYLDTAVMFSVLYVIFKKSF